MVKTRLIFVMFLLSGCLSQSRLDKTLTPKQEDQSAHLNKKTIQVFRIFGKHQGYLADYDQVSGNLRAVHKVVIIGSGSNFWPTLQEDARLAREPRYFAVSRTPIPAITEGADLGSFRADLFRGHPVHESVVGHNVLIQITGTRFSAPASKPAGTHIILGDTKELHAVPQTAGDDLVSFSVVDGIKPVDGLWASANLKPVNSRPATTTMGCLENFEGELLADTPDGGSGFWGVCEKKAPAGL